MTMGAGNPMEKVKQKFEDLGSALQAGDLSGAKKALAELQKNAPGKGSDGKSTEIDNLSKALDSGDLSAAKNAYSKIQEKMSQGPPAGARPPQGAPTGASGVSLDTGGEPAKSGTGKSGGSRSSGSSSSNKTYDKMDANKDGKVSAREEFDYELAHPKQKESDAAATSSSGQDKTTISTYA